MCLDTYKLDPAKLLLAPRLAWKPALQKTKIKLDLLTDIDMLLMVDKGIRGEISHSIYWYAEANNKYMNYYDKSKDSSDIQYGDVSNLSGWSMSQKLPANKLQGIKDTSQFNENFIKRHNEESNEGSFLKLMFSVLINYMNFTAIYHFYQK